MFEIGENLRAARVAGDLTFEEIERRTHIRPKFIAALEAERFDRLPGDAYARSFLREYTHLLGLDSKPFLDEFDVLHGDSGPAPPALERVPSRSRTPSVVLIAGALLATSVGLFVWRAGMPTRAPRVDSSSGRQAAHTTMHATTPPRTQARHSAATRRIVVTAARGRCWLEVRVGSRTGPVVYEGTLEAGRALSFARDDLWVRFGAPWNVDVRADARRIALAGTSAPVNVQFRRGIAQMT